MKKTATLLPRRNRVGGCRLGIATDSNAKSAARSSMSDLAYCQLLSDLHRAYDEQNMDAAVTEAINECNRQYGRRIPVLEKALTNDTATLSPRRRVDGLR